MVPKENKKTNVIEFIAVQLGRWFSCGQHVQCSFN